MRWRGGIGGGVGIETVGLRWLNGCGTEEAATFDEPSDLIFGGVVSSTIL